MTCARAASPRSCCSPTSAVDRHGRAALRELRGAWRECARARGDRSTRVPFWLVAWGEKHIDSGDRRDRAGDGADLLAADRPALPPARAARRAASCSASASASSASAFSRAATPTGDGGPSRHARGRALVGRSTRRRGSTASSSCQGTISGPVLATGVDARRRRSSCCRSRSSTRRRRCRRRARSGRCSRWRCSARRSRSCSSSACSDRFGARQLSLVTYLMPGFALVYGAADPRRARSRLRRWSGWR